MRDVVLQQRRVVHTPTAAAPPMALLVLTVFHRYSDRTLTKLCENSLMRRKRFVFILVGSFALLLLAGIILGLRGGADRASQPLSAEATLSPTIGPQPIESETPLIPTLAEQTAAESNPETPSAKSTAVQVESTSSEPEPTATVPRPTPTEPEPTPTEVVLGCCQCTAVGMDQDVPFGKPDDVTCGEFCFQGCLERGHGKLVCTLGRVGGYELACPWMP